MGVEGWGLVGVAGLGCWGFWVWFGNGGIAEIESESKRKSSVEKKKSNLRVNLMVENNMESKTATPDVDFIPVGSFIGGKNMKEKGEGVR